MSIPGPVQIRPRFLALLSGLLLAPYLASCAGDAPPSDSSDAAAAERTEIPDPSSASTPSAAPRVNGAVSFQVDGRTVELDYLPEGAGSSIATAMQLVGFGYTDGERPDLTLTSGRIRAEL